MKNLLQLERIEVSLSTGKLQVDEQEMDNCHAFRMPDDFARLEFESANVSNGSTPPSGLK